MHLAVAPLAEVKTSLVHDGGHHLDLGHVAGLELGREVALLAGPLLAEFRQRGGGDFADDAARLQVGELRVDDCKVLGLGLDLELVDARQERDAKEEKGERGRLVFLQS